MRGTYGFFRPLGLALFRGEALLFGWDAPWGWALVSGALHLLNALLLAELLRRLGAGTVGAAAGAALFAVSPWASEALFWTSAQPDLLAVAALLTAVLAGLAGEDARGRRRAGLLGIAFLAGALALLSKEMAITLPVLYLLVALAASPAGARDALRRAAAPTTGFAALSLGYLALRGVVLPDLTGPYGRFTDLVRAGTLLPSVAGQLGAIVLPPFFAGDAFREAGAAGQAIFAALLATAVFLAFRDRRRAALLLALALVVSFAPVIWSVPPPGSTAGGRVRYLPGLFACALFALGVSRSATETRRARGRETLAVAAILLGLISLATQRRLWGVAASLSRQSIAQVRALAPLTEPIFVTNLPFALAEGPYVLKSYAFRYALGADAVQGVRANAVTYEIRGDALVAVHTEPDPFSDSLSAPPPDTSALSCSISRRRRPWSQSSVNSRRQSAVSANAGCPSRRRTWFSRTSASIAVRMKQR